MRKIVCCVFFIALSVGSVFSDSDDIDTYLDECKASEKASDADITNMQKREQPTSKVEKCLVTCLMEKMEILKDNQINKDGYLQLVVPRSIENAELVTEIVNECKSIKDADRCEYGVKAVACLAEGAAKREVYVLL